MAIEINRLYHHWLTLQSQDNKCKGYTDNGYTANNYYDMVERERELIMRKMTDAYEMRI